MVEPSRTTEKEGREYLRVAEVARAFHVSPKTVARWADEGRLPYVLTLGGHRRFPRQAIEDLLPKLAGERASRHD